MGIAMRATADDQMAVQACGIPVTRVFSTSWMFACVVAAIGGVLISSIGGITHGLVETGLEIVLRGHPGRAGLLRRGDGCRADYRPGGKPRRRLPDAISSGAGSRDIIPFVIIIIVMVIKPYGLFGEKTDREDYNG